MWNAYSADEYRIASFGDRTVCPVGVHHSTFSDSKSSSWTWWSIYYKEVGRRPLEMPLGVLDSSSWISFVNRGWSKWDLVLSLFLITRRLKTLITGCGNTQRESKQNAQHILLYISHYYCICSICSHFLCHCLKDSFRFLPLLGERGLCTLSLVATVTELWPQGIEPLLVKLLKQLLLLCAFECEASRHIKMSPKLSRQHALHPYFPF